MSIWICFKWSVRSPRRGPNMNLWANCDHLLAYFIYYIRDYAPAKRALWTPENFLSSSTNLKPHYVSCYSFVFISLYHTSHMKPKSSYVRNVFFFPQIPYNYRALIDNRAIQSIISTTLLHWSSLNICPYFTTKI